MVDSIKSQELAIEKVKYQLEQLKYLGDEGLLKESEYAKMEQLQKQLGIMESKLSQSKDDANAVKRALVDGTKPGIKEINKGLKNINSNVEKFGKRITSLIASAFIFNVLSNGLRKLKDNFTSLLKTDDKFSSSLNQIKANLMTAFAPIFNAALPAINQLMNGLAKLTGTIAAFTASLFGTSLSDASKQAEQLSDSLNDVDKSGEKATGSLASFDKLNVVGGNDGGGSSKQDTIDYSGEIQVSQKLLDFLNKIKEFVTENKDAIIGFLVGVAAGILAIKLGCDLLMAGGIALFIGGLVFAIISLIEFLKDPTFENFINVIIGIGVAILGLAIIIGSLPLAIVAACVLIVAVVLKYYDQIMGLFDKALKWLKEDFMQWMIDKFGFVGYIVAKKVIDAVNLMKSAFESFYGGLKKIVTGIVQLFKGDFTNGIKNVFGGLKDIFLMPINFLITALNNLIDGINNIGFDVPDWVPVIGGKRWNFNIPRIPRLAEGAVIPPRQEFMAVLGDQKHGTNIETPLETMKDAFRSVLNEKGTNNQDREIVLRNLTMIAQFGTKTFQKLTIDSIRAEEKETGTTLLLN